jgi:sodium/hydrogen antiporter
VVGRVVVGVLAGAAVGWVLAKLAFRARRQSMRLSEQGEPLLALAALATSYGAAEALHGYGFLAVFCCGMAIRNSERHHDYQAAMHGVVERLERLITLLVLLCLGMAMTRGLLSALDWRGVTIGVALVLLVRPLAGVISLVPFVHGSQGMGARERLVTAFFGVRGVGSIFYLAYAAGEADFSDLRWLWATVAFTIGLSVVVHGVLAKPAMNWLERAERRAEALAGRTTGDPTARPG